MSSHFDHPIDRRNTHSLKWDRYGSRDVIPLWVADMDFMAPPPVLEAMKARLEHGVFGYTHVPRALTDAVVEHIARDFAWDIAREWIVWLPGLVSGLNIAVRAAGNPESTDLVFTPIYPPFLQAPGLAGHKLITVPLLQNSTTRQWTIDFDALEQTTPSEGGQLLLCNPHNPVGRAFQVDELRRIADFCIAHNITIVSDEIHNGLILDSSCGHTCIASLGSEIAARTITLMAPSKTYNIPGLGCSFAIIPDSSLRSRFHKVMEGIVPHGTIFGYEATLAAYQHGESWRQELLEYLRGNYSLLQRAISAIPSLQLTPLEATYLAWIDTRSLSVTNPARFFEDAGVGLSDGREFGLPGFVRLNFGCTHALLEQALERMKRAVQQIQIPAP